MFTQDLTHNLTVSLSTLYKTTPTVPMTCVEIGAFEGKGSQLIARALCAHKDSKLYCIDPLDDEYVKGDARMTFWDSACKGQRARFYNNVKDIPNIITLQGTSDDMLPIIKDNSIDFAYIDGDHSPEQVYKDATTVFGKMKKGGIVLFDDYRWERDGMKTAEGIDRFLGEHAGKYDLLFKNWQLAIRVK